MPTEGLSAEVRRIVANLRSRANAAHGKAPPSETAILCSEAAALIEDLARPPEVCEALIKHMADRFLHWRLPENFHPDNGISYQRPNYHPSVDATPTGTNLFSADQAAQMVRYMAEGLPRAEGPAPPGGGGEEAVQQPVIEQPGFDYFECPECGFSSVQSADFSGSDACPLCAGDSGHDVGMHRRTCRETDVAEGKDARAALTKGADRG